MNADLISRQAAIDVLDKTCDIVCQYTKKQRAVMCGACSLGSAFDVIEELPSAQPEIVRCDDCKHYDDGLCRRWKYSHVTSEDSFCSDAERRNGWEE